MAIRCLTKPRPPSTQHTRIHAAFPHSKQQVDLKSGRECFDNALEWMFKSLGVVLDESLITVMAMSSEFSENGMFTVVWLK